MDDCGLLTALFPELEPSRRCALEYYGPGGVLAHTFAALDRADLMFRRLPLVFPGVAGSVAEQLASCRGGAERRRALLRLAVLFHDVAKPSTARRIKGRLRFFGHDAKGAQAASAIMKRLRFSREETATVAAVIAHHLRPGNLAAAGLVTDRAARRFFRDTGEHAVSLLLVAWADHASYLPEDRLLELLPLAKGGLADEEFQAPPGLAEDAAKTLRHLWTISVLLARRFRRPVRPLERLIDGNDVMRVLGLEPGPEVGKILGKVARARALGRLASRSQALALIERFRPE